MTYKEWIEYRHEVTAGKNVISELGDTSELWEFFTALTIAQVTHAANKAWCEAHGDYSQTSWEDAPQWQKNSAIIGVIYKLRNPDATPSQQHDAWMQLKLAKGWKFGYIRTPVDKTHPCLVPYDELPYEQRKKDELFGAIVNALSDVGGRNVGT